MKKNSVRYLQVGENEVSQRLDNFLMAQLKGVPKSRVYRMIRKGEVRVNMKRISPFYRLSLRDKIRLPPLSLAKEASHAPPSQHTVALLTNRILYEDDYLLILNKPSGMSVHAGSTVRMGVIEALRHIYPQWGAKLELAHRLDTETSGCLILAKKKRILRELHTLLKEGGVTKIYWALTKGKWKADEQIVEVPLRREYRAGGKYLVMADEGGQQEGSKFAATVFRPIQTFKTASLVEARLLTGRTHQIRVHAQYCHHPIAGDDRYGEAAFNRFASQRGVKRLFLHARSIDFTLPSLQQPIRVVAPLDSELSASLKVFDEYNEYNEYNE